MIKLAFVFLLNIISPSQEKEINIGFKRSKSFLYINNDQALIEAKKTLSLAQRSENAEAIGRSEHLVGYVLVIKKEYPLAIKYLLKSEDHLLENSNRANLYITLSYLFSLTEFHEKTASYSKKAISLINKKEVNLLTHANFYLSGALLKKNPDSTFTLLNNNLILAKGDSLLTSEAYSNLGYSYIKVKNYNAAITYLIKGLSFAPSDETKALITNNISFAYINLSEYKLAIDFALISIAYNSPGVLGEAYTTLAYSYIRTGALNKAEEEIIKSLPYKKDMMFLSSAYEMLISAYQSKGDRDKVILYQSKNTLILKDSKLFEAIDIVAKHETIRSLDRLEALRSERKANEREQKLLTYILIIGECALLALLLARYIYTYYRSRVAIIGNLYQMLNDDLKGQ